MGKTALVLSAGGMFGSYQAGVWEVLADLWEPDMVVGASVGCLNGWLIAGKRPPSELVSRWSALGPLAELQLQFPTRLSHGILDNRRLEECAREIVSISQPQLDYGLVLTEMPRLKQRLVRSPEVDWQHLLACCSVPGVLSMQRIDGRLYSDGGILDPLPLWAAIEMGATAAICINVMKIEPGALHTVVRAARAYAKYSPPASDALPVVEISPSQPLGRARDSAVWTAANAQRWMDLGRRDAQDAKHLVVKCLEDCGSFNSLQPKRS